MIFFLADFQLRIHKCLKSMFSLCIIPLLGSNISSQASGTRIACDYYRSCRDCNRITKVRQNHSIWALDKIVDKSIDHRAGSSGDGIFDATGMFLSEMSICQDFLNCLKSMACLSIIIWSRIQEHKSHRKRFKQEFETVIDCSEGKTNKGMIIVVFDVIIWLQDLTAYQILIACVSLVNQPNETKIRRKVSTDLSAQQERHLPYFLVLSTPNAPEHRKCPMGTIVLQPTNNEN